MPNCGQLADLINFGADLYCYVQKTNARKSSCLMHYATTGLFG